MLCTVLFHRRQLGRSAPGYSAGNLGMYAPPELPPPAASQCPPPAVWGCRPARCSPLQPAAVPAPGQGGWRSHGLRPPACLLLLGLLACRLLLPVGCGLLVCGVVHAGHRAPCSPTKAGMAWVVPQHGEREGGLQLTQRGPQQQRRHLGTRPAPPCWRARQCALTGGCMGGAAHTAHHVHACR